MCFDDRYRQCDRSFTRHNQTTLSHAMIDRSRHMARGDSEFCASEAKAGFDRASLGS